MASLRGIFGKDSAAYQLFVWQVASSIVGAILGPTLEILSQEINAAEPVVELTPAELAQLAARAYMNVGDAADAARRSGLNAERFNQLVSLAKGGLAVGDLAEALRRGIIPRDGLGESAVSFEQGTREAGLHAKWVDVAQDLAVKWPTPTDALDALLEGQVSADEGRRLYERFGGDPQYFTMLFNTRGNAPTPVEALTLANRGIIPWRGTGPNVVSYEQAFLEGPWRNKWLDPFIALGEYLPPPRTVTAMVRSGALDTKTATDLLVKQGLSKELAAAYVNDALSDQNKSERDLTTSQLLSMYGAGLVKQEDIVPILSAIGYSDQSIEWLLSYKDMQRAISAVNSAVTRIHSLYVSHKLDGPDAKQALLSLHVPADQVADIVSTWDIERSANVATLTAAQIASAWGYEIISRDEAMAELESLGYTPRDAWIYLSIKAKAPLDDAPPAGPGPILPQ